MTTRSTKPRNFGGRKYTLENVEFPYSKIRRDKMRELKICINASFRMKDFTQVPGAVEHGEPVKGGRCQRCCDVHAKSRKPYASRFGESAYVDGTKVASE